MTEEEEAALRSWAIQFQPSDLEVELWNARRVKITTLTSTNLSADCARRRHNAHSASSPDSDHTGSLHRVATLHGQRRRSCAL